MYFFLFLKMFAIVADPDPDPSTLKQNSKKNLHSLRPFIFEKWCKCRFKKVIILPFLLSAVFYIWQARSLSFFVIFSPVCLSLPFFFFLFSLFSLVLFHFNDFLSHFLFTSSILSLYRPLRLYTAFPSHLSLFIVYTGCHTFVLFLMFPNRRFYLINLCK